MLEAPKCQQAVRLQLVSWRQKYTGDHSPLTISTTTKYFLIVEIVSDQTDQNLDLIFVVHLEHTELVCGSLP